jgi:hypothetical protein
MLESSLREKYLAERNETVNRKRWSKNNRDADRKSLMKCIGNICIQPVILFYFEGAFRKEAHILEVFLNVYVYQISMYGLDRFESYQISVRMVSIISNKYARDGSF